MIVVVVVVVVERCRVLSSISGELCTVSLALSVMCTVGVYVIILLKIKQTLMVAQLVIA